MFKLTNLVISLCFVVVMVEKNNFTILDGDGGDYDKCGASDDEK